MEQGGNKTPLIYSLQMLYLHCNYMEQGGVTKHQLNLQPAMLYLPCKYRNKGRREQAPL